MISRSQASGGAVWHLENLDDSVTYLINLTVPGSYELRLRYSNDDTGFGDRLRISTPSRNEVLVTQDTGSGGQGWNNFVESPRIFLGEYTPGFLWIRLTLEETDGYGVDLDRLTVIGTSE